jgi:hypothetical protein
MKTINSSQNAGGVISYTQKSALACRALNTSTPQDGVDRRLNQIYGEERKHMEFLKEYLGEELYAQVAAKLGDNDKVKLANLATGDYVGRDKFTAADTAKAQLEAKLQEQASQLEQLQQSAASTETLQAEMAKLQAANDAIKTEYEGKLASTKLGYLLENRLVKEGAVNTKAVMALLDSSKLALEGDKLTGLDEQLGTIRETEKWAFTQPNVPGAGGNPTPAPVSTAQPLPQGVICF